MRARIQGYKIDETLAESSSTLVCRGRRLADGEPLVLKILKPEASSKDTRTGFRREFEITARFALPGVVGAYGLEDYQGGLMMVLEDIGGESLERLLGRGAISLEMFLEVAIALADTLGLLHKQRIIHKNINPSHIIWNPDTKRLNLIDFGIADEAPERSVTPRHPAALEGTLKYVSPEQTGRVNRPVDYRTDFYSLGVTFYQMLTRRLPFDADDALGMVHCHIAGIPVPPHGLDPAIPETISLIVMKLMAKAADDRYQSASGLKADLERCRAELAGKGVVGSFVPGAEDVSDQLRIPRKLYGRGAETSRLLEAFERVCAGERELVLVAGYAGIGKTALVNETHTPIVEKRGFFIEGKFDQLRRTVPYFAWTQAFAGFVNYLLMESEAELTRWKQVILRAVGSVGRVVTDVIPNLELVIGPQPDLPALGPEEARNRFTYVFLEFIKALATREHPLVVFLDDLQWIDAASLTLLKTLMSSAGVSNILVIGAYRDNEVAALHPLAMTIEGLRKGGARIDLMTLGALSQDTVNELLADILRHERSATVPLARLLYAKTGGNPFFLLQTLRALVERQTISFDIRNRCWQWDISLLKGLEITGNVVELMLGKIRQLPVCTQQVLPLAACMGFRFEPSHLGIIAGQAEDSIVENLRPALREGLLSPLDGGYQFAHDRIQQAAYSLIPDTEKKQVHLKIGRLLLEHLSGQDHEEQLFSVVDHLNMAAELLTTRSEKLESARLNLRAGLKAKGSSAFSAAAGYFEAGVGMLDGESWDTEYGLALELHSRAAEAASLVGDFERTDRLFGVISANARIAVDLVGAYESKIDCFTSRGCLQEALDTALEILDKLGLRLPGYPSDHDIERALEETTSLYADIPIEDLINLPHITDSNKAAITRITAKAGPAAFNGRPALCLLFVLTQVSQAIRYGNPIEAAYLYAGYALILCGSLRDFDTGYRFGSLALALLETTDTVQYRSRTLEVIADHVVHFRQHLRTTLPYLEAGYQSGLETGDFEHAGYNATSYCCHSYFAGVELRQRDQVMDTYGEAVKRIRPEVESRILAPYRQALKNLLSSSGDPCRLVGTCFNQEEMLPILEQTQDSAAMAAFHAIRLSLFYLFGNYPQALESAELVEKNKAGILAMFPHSVSIFYDSLTRIQLYPHRVSLEQTQILERVSANQRELRRLADSAPMNFLHKFYLVEAERMRLAGEDMAALDCYDQAVSLARENEYVQEEALANELAARFWLEKGKEDIARLYLTKARHCYGVWGASRKVRDLEERYSNLLPHHEMTEIAAEQLDLSTLIKAAQAISGEMEMDRLLGKVMHSSIENAAAQCGFLLVEKAGQWLIAARGEIDRTEVHMPRPISLDDSEEISPGVVHFVARTREIVALDDAANRGDFKGDPRIRARRSKSLLCAPLLSRGRLAGILYLENNLATHVFTPERLRLLEVILSQAATALENAGVYEALKESEARYRLIVDTAAEGILVVGPDSLTTFVNARMAEILGCSGEEMIGRPWTDFMFEEDLPDHLRKMENRRRGMSESYERRFRRNGGRTVWTHLSATPIFADDHHFLGSFAMFTDITERKEAEEEIRRLKNYLANIIDSMPSILVGMDRDETVTQWNRQAEEMYGISARKAVGRPITDLLPDFSPWIAAMRSEIDQQRPADMEKLLIEKEGERRFYDLMLYPISTNGAEGAVVRIEDVTERARIQELMIQTEKMMSVGGMAAGMAHEINNPLGIISQAAQNIERRVSPELPANRKAAEELGVDMEGIKAYFEKRQIPEFVGSIREASLRASRIIANMLQFSRCAGTTMQPGSLAGVIDQALELAAGDYDLKKKFDFRSIEIVRDYAPDMPEVPMVVVEVEQVMLNLLKNAAQAMTLNQHDRKPRITLRLCREKRYALIELEDNGPGMADAVRRRVFEPFFTTKEPGMGTGLGLSVSYMIVTQNHKGLMEVESKPGTGACFRVRLPLSKEGIHG